MACEDARTNLPPAVRVEHGPVERVLASSYDEPFDLVVLDPPREGARRPVVEQVVDRAPRAVAYVACDPAALARDLAIFAEHGYRLRTLRAFDLFPMTHHVECVALLEPAHVCARLRCRGLDDFPSGVRCASGEERLSPAVSDSR